MGKYFFDFEDPLKAIEDKIISLQNTSSKTGIDVDAAISKLKEDLVHKREEIYSNLTRWQKVQLARHPDRPHAIDYIDRIVANWYEFHGDRLFSDDLSIVGGCGYINNIKFMIISQEKGRGTNDKVKRNFGMMRPEGYRKANRLMKLAEKFNIPILSIIDTPGAYPGIGAEERGQAEAIASNLITMASLRVPIIALVIGEGASGGALGIGLADRILCLENTWYSVISPEGCASILFRDPTKCVEAADAMKVTADDLYKFNICDRIIIEPKGGAHVDYKETTILTEKAIMEEYAIIKKINSEDLVTSRMEKYQNMGVWRQTND